MLSKTYLWIASLMVSFLLLLTYYVLGINNGILQISLIIAIVAFFLIALYLSMVAQDEAIKSASPIIDSFVTAQKFVKATPVINLVDLAYWWHSSYSGNYRGHEFTLNLLSMRKGMLSHTHLPDYFGEEVFVLLETPWPGKPPRFDIPRKIYIEDSKIRCYIRGSELSESMIRKYLDQISSILEKENKA